ncbi:chemotaxis protein CheB [Starkeya koreensis]|uniref:protein-glutamate methylesterase n=1 Tax=Ancylobacter koreensis TaxID=266121 RepID=A0ABT0DIU8_9HYPH|nr:chemotaxis protein CheB [Ancylobacter koreensis]MCK0207129.1 chemotaxis protein CheB [Ancylobacter koreensis]
MSAPRAEAVVIGASAGALEALSAILPALPARFPLPVMVVVHIPPDRRSLLAELFQAKCRVIVMEAEDKEPISPGTVYFAPADYHLLIEHDRTLSLSSDEPVLFSRPSIDVLFESAADAYGDALVAIVLTGANDDGAKGMRAVVEAGGRALVQTPESAFASAMPRAAIDLCPVARVMPLAAIAAYLLEV